MSDDAPTLTRLQRAGPGRVALEVDGTPWRTVPDAVVAGCGLAAGVELDRPLLRRLRAELRRAEAMEVATRAVVRRDLPRERVRERLRRTGVGSATREEVLRTLEGAGVLDDARLARARATALAERGWGDAAIAMRLEQDGIGHAEASASLAELPPERDRAADLVANERDTRRAAQLLARRGFAPEVVEEVLRAVEDGESDIHSPPGW